MTRKPTLPMTPAALPQQRVNMVVELPPKPDSVELTVGYDIFPEEAMRRRPRPRAPELFVHVEWAETPMHSGVSAFYIEGRRRHWLLWDRWLDDNAWTPRWRWSAAGYCPRKGIDRRTAAIHLLIEFWTMEDATLDDDDHWINEPGMLSVEEVRAMARAVRARL